jgi:protein polybromo-1
MIQIEQIKCDGMNFQDASWLANQPKLSSKSKSGYILFSAEVRKRVMNEHPEAGFGEVSRLVGIEWKKLSDEHKHQFETRAQIIADERTKAQLLTPSSKPLQPGQIRVYCCKWQDCDFQFDSLEGLVKHVQSGHTELGMIRIMFFGFINCLH